MALPLPPGLTHSEVAFVAEMEMVTVVPRQRLESIGLLSGATPALRPPHRADLPLWLALLLKKQRRANIVPPPWLHPASLSEIIHRETHEEPSAFSPPPPPPTRANAHRPGTVASRRFPANNANNANNNYDDSGDHDELVLSPPFTSSCTAAAPAGYLPYHWLEVAEALLAHAADDMAAPAGEVRGLLRDLVEVRAAKLRSSTAPSSGAAADTFGGALMSLRGVGALELAENRGFVLGVVDGVRAVGASAEATRREEEEEEEEDRAGFGGGGEDDYDDDMGL